MQKNIHYNLTFKLAVDVGFSVECAQQIAWADQFVDDCIDFEKYGFRTMVNIAFQTLDCFIPEVQRSVFVPFHFLPGSKDSLIVKRNSELVQKIIQGAMKTNDRIALGIALHGFQDSYSHEGFSGVQSDDNAKHKWNLTSMLAPRIGHAEFGLDPDVVRGKWYNQNGLYIKNNEKFKEAAIETYRILYQFAKGCYPKFDPVNVLQEIDEFLEIKDYEKGKEFLFKKSGIDPKNICKRYSNFSPSQYLIENFVEYSKKQQSLVYEYMSI